MPDNDEFDDFLDDQESKDGEGGENTDADARFWQELNDLDWNSAEEDALDHITSERNERLGQLPVMLKAREILHLTEAIVATIDEKSDMFHLCPQMLENAMLIGAKIVRAEASEFYSPKMESAVLVKINAMELLNQLSLGESEALINLRDAALLREEIADFRRLFVNWASTFDPTNDQPDEWELFKPRH